MAKKNSSYWKERFTALEEEQYERSAVYYKDVQKQFREASNDIQMDVERWYQRLADNNGISYMSAKKFLKNAELEEFKWTVEQYIKAGEENAIDGRWMKELENASARYHISYLEAMKMQIQQHAELLSAQYEGGVTDFLHKSYSENYYRQAYEISKGTGVGANLRKLDSKKVDIVIKKPWAQDEANFSDRIWTNKKKLIQNLHTELTQNIIRGASPKQAIDSLAKTMEVSKRQAGTLIMTESAAIASKAQQDSFKELGVEEFEVVETLDGSTCEICQEMDGKHFLMTDFKVGETAPPFHPRCRGCTCPYFDDEFTVGEVRAARSPETGKTVYVDGNMSYGEWKNQYLNLSEDSFFDDIKKKVKGSLLNAEIIPYRNLPGNIRIAFESGLYKAERNTALLLKKESVETDYYILSGKKSEYVRGVNVVGIAPDAEPSTLAHELFHKIDIQNGVTERSNIINNFVSDFGKINDITNLMRAKYPGAFEYTYDGRLRLKEDYRGISDIISALSYGQINFGYGHSPGYWNRDADVRIQEIWAQYGRIYFNNNPDVIFILKELFPSGTERVNIKLRRLAENVER